MTLLNKLVLNFFAMLLFTFSILILNRLNKPNITISKEKNKTNFQEKFYSYFNFGNKRFYSKLIWINTLLSSDVEKVQNENSWMFYNFKSIQSLDPFFLSNYIFSTIYLSVIKNDLEGSNEMIKLAMKYYYYNYELNYFAGVHYLNEMQDYEKALEFFLKIKDHPKAPPYLNSLIAKLYYKKDNSELSLKILEETLSSNILPQFIKEHFRKSIYTIKSNIDLNCLNSNGKNCNRIDYFGHEYLKNINGTYYSKFKFKDFKIYKPRS